MKINERQVSLVLVPLLIALNACGMGDEGDLQRDVYTKFEDCVADWGKPELCQQMADAEAKQFASSTGVDHSQGPGMIFWGPAFYGGGGGSRAVSFDGQTYAASGNRAMSKPLYVRQTPVTSQARASPGTPVRSSSSGGGGGTSRGGLGASSAAAVGG